MIAVRNASKELITVERGVSLALSVGLIEDEALSDYVDVLRETLDETDGLPSEPPDCICVNQEELAPCDVDQGTQLSLPLDSVPGLSAAVEGLMRARKEDLSLDALTLAGVNAPQGCEAGQLYYVASLLCEALDSCLGRRRFWWTDVILSKGAPSTENRQARQWRQDVLRGQRTRQSG